LNIIAAGTFQHVRHIFFAAHSFTTLADFNRQALDWRNQVAHQRPWPGDDPRTVAQVFAEEKPHLLPIAGHPFSCDLTRTVYADNPSSRRREHNGDLLHQDGGRGSSHCDVEAGKSDFRVRKNFMGL
jgi:hypothetical protein